MEEHEALAKSVPFDLQWIGVLGSYLERVTPLGLAIDHIHDLVMDLRSSCVSSSPVVARTCSAFVDEEVLGIVDLFVWTRLDGVDDLIGTN